MSKRTTAPARESRGRVVAPSHCKHKKIAQTMDYFMRDPQIPTGCACRRARAGACGGAGASRWLLRERMLPGRR
eukprot:13450762-Alexandrium_andersonii.AAC.1